MVHRKFLGVTVASTTLQGIENTSAQGAFRARMQAQCFQVERYRMALLINEGRRLTPDEAALEWITRFAKAFADFHDAA
ncbi:MAG: hypothetical protein ACJAUG_000634 [Halioglobus sp.]|jgi:hypothetical protein